jgi:predicted alpha/beta hydrolase family esterase
MVAWTGVEPVTLGLEVPCSIQLSYQAMSFKTYVFDSELAILFLKILINIVNFQRFVNRCYDLCTMNKQLFVIHGGDSFDTYEEYIAALRSIELDLSRATFKGWKQQLPLVLGENVEVIQPRMPNPNNAKYLEWKIWFEKHIPFMQDQVILIGHSLGGIFLAKYLSEEKFPKKICATLLVAAPYATDSQNSLGDFNLKIGLERFKEQGGEIFLFQSKDDEIVPYADVELYQEKLPNAHLITFDDRGHFHAEEFPEVTKIINEIHC